MWIRNWQPSLTWWAFVFFVLCATDISAQPGITGADTVITYERGRKVLTVIVGSTKSVTRTRDGKKDGFQESFNEKGKLFRRESWKDGHEDGEFVCMDFFGRLGERKTYLYVADSGRSYLHGRSENYMNGVLEKRSEYRLGKLHGTQVVYYNNGMLKERTTYLNGLKSGKEEGYHNNGQLSYSGLNAVIVAGGVNVSVKHGEWKFFLANGKMSALTNYNHGKKEGRCVEYFPNGEMRMEAIYKADKRHGRVVNFASDGQVESEFVVYEDTVIDGKRKSYVYDGDKLQYHPNGKLKAKESFAMGVKTGVWETYSSTGLLYSRVEYKDDFKNGKEQWFDDEGRLTMEVNYAICKKDTVLAGCKNGIQRSWKDGVLTSESTFVNDVEEGIRKYWTEKGVLVASYVVSDGVYAGPFQEYWKNGSLKTKGVYVKLKGNGRKFSRLGWMYRYNEEGRLESKSLFDTLDEARITILYNEQGISSYDMDRCFSMTSFPDSGIKSFVFNPYYGMPYVAAYFYRNGAIRKFLYPDAEKYIVNALYFDDKGKNISDGTTMHENADSIRSSVAVKKKALSLMRNDWRSNNLFADSVLNGVYKLTYQNGQPMASLSFSDDLPDGDWVLFDPLSGDTAMYKYYIKGVQSGYYLDKFGGKTVLSRGWYPKDTVPGYEELYSVRGIPTRKRSYRTNKNFPIENYEYYENGVVRSYQNYETGEHRSWSLTGELFTQNKKIKDSLVQYLEYYPDTRQLRYERYTIDGKLDSISKAWFKSGKPQYLVNYRKGEREGSSLMFNEQGDTTSFGEYVKDKAEGWFVEYKNGKKEFAYYVEGRRAAQPGQFECACIDTSYSSGTVKFAQSVSSMVDYDVFENYLAPWLKPVDSLNFESNFFTGFQADGRNNSGFAGMNLMMFDEVAVDIPANRQMRLVLNPCRTKGYISRMEYSMSYTSDPQEVRVTAEPKQVTLSLLSGPAVSLVPQYPFPTMLVKTKSLSYDFSDKIKLEEPTVPERCMTSVLVNDIMEIRKMKGVYHLFSNGNYFFAGDLISENIVKQQELNDFFGFSFKEGAVLLSFKWGDSDRKVAADVNMLLLNSRFAAGCISLPLQLDVENEMNVFDVKNNPLPVREVETALTKAGFRRVKSVKDHQQSKVLIYWFAE
ncbi:MAG: hypothetical protein U0Y08_10970 [Bacteroidia bacterium]